jgi:uncharacterized membrane protein (UPF0127 family)
VSVDNHPGVHHLRIADARTMRQRLIGLLGKPPLPPGHALRLSPCRAIHTIGMRHPIDVLFVDRAGVVCGIRRCLPPWRVAIDWHAAAVLELLHGEAARLGVGLGDRVATHRD